MKRNVNNVSKIELHFMGIQRIGESIERLLRCRFEFFDNTDDLVKRRLVDQTAWSINEQTNVLVKLNFRWKLHRSFGFSLLSCRHFGVVHGSSMPHSIAIAASRSALRSFSR